VADGGTTCASVAWACSGDGSSASASRISFLKPFKAFPMPSPIFGNFPAPKTMSTMTRMRISSVIPRDPNIRLLYLRVSIAVKEGRLRFSVRDLSANSPGVLALSQGRADLFALCPPWRPFAATRPQIYADGRRVGPVVLRRAQHDRNQSVRPELVEGRAARAPRGKGRVLARPGWEGEMVPVRRHPLVQER